MNRHVWTIVLVAALAACGSKKKEEAPPATGSGSATAVVPADADAGSAQGSAEPAAAVDVPTAVDFEELATSEITDKTVEAHVKDIEKDLAQ